MKVLKKYIQAKNEQQKKLSNAPQTKNSNDTKINNRIISDKSLSFISESKATIISFENKKLNLLNDQTKPMKTKPTKKILERENLSINYIKIILEYFLLFFEFLFRKKKRPKEGIRKEKGDDGIIYYYINKIDLEHVYDFVNIIYKYYKNSTKNFILSKMRKYSRLFNDDNNNNYKHKIPFPYKKPTNVKINQQDIENIINHLKINNDLENLIIFYFLYYSGLTFSDISRIIPFHFKMEFSLLKIRKGKERKIFIPKVISDCLIIFNENRKKTSKFFFM